MSEPNVFGMLWLNQAEDYPLGGSTDSHSESSSTPRGFDIIAVHGLNGHRERSWCLGSVEDDQTKGRKTWLEALLPGQVPNARVLTFGYDSGNIPDGVVSKTGISDKARELLEALTKVADRQERYRPIVFVSRDLGGSIVKRALVIAHNESRYRSIATQTRCLVFFLTPHRGEGLLGWEDLVFNIAIASAQHPHQGFARGVREASLSLMQLEEEFNWIAKWYNVVDIYLEKDADGPVPVDEFAATMDIPSEERIPRKANFTTVSWFSGGDEQLEVLCGKINSASSDLRSDYVEQLEKLLLLSPRSYQAKQHRHQQATLDWVLKHDQYRTWLKESKPSILHIHGLRGSGAGHLSHLLFQSLRQAVDLNTASTVLYFSFSEHYEHQISVVPLFISLITQALLIDKSNFETFERLYEYTRNQTCWVKEELWVLFRTLLTYPGERQMVCIIDGLHECDSSRIQFLKDLVAITEANEWGFKVILTSRSRADIHTCLDSCEEINLDTFQELQSDTRHYIKAGTARLAEKCPRFRGLEGEVVDAISACDGSANTVWISLTLRQLESLSHRSTPRVIRDALQTLPRTVTGVFQSILNSIPKKDRNWARKALTWILHSLRPLKLNELAVALAIDNGVLDEDNISQDLASDLEQTFGILFKIDGDCVHLTHPSATKVLNQDPEGTEVWYYVKLSAHRDIALSCLAYLSIKEVQDTASLLMSKDSGLDLPPSATSSYGLLRYAAESWPIHHRLAERMQSSESVLTFFEDKSRWQVWSRLYWRVRNTLIKPEPSFLHPLPVAAQFGLVDVVEVLLDGDASGPQDRALALNQATENGWVEVVKQLLDAGGQDSTSIAEALTVASGLGDEHGAKELIAFVKKMQLTIDCPPLLLCRAARLGRATVVSQLLQAGADVNAKYDGATALHFAAESGHSQVVDVLIEAGADLEATDDFGFTPLGVAVYWCIRPVVQQFLQAGSRVDFVTNERESPLHLTASAGSPIVTVMLLGHGADPQAKDSTSKTPLFVAARNGFYGMTETLLDCHVDIDAQDDSGLAPLHASVMRRKRETARLLLQFGAQVDIRDHEERTALHHAVSANSADISELLLEAGADVNAVNKDKETPLILASGQESSKIVDILLKRGASVLEKDVNDFTALHRAANTGSLETVRKLLESGADVHEVTSQGVTPLAFASARGHNAMAKLLLENGANHSVRNNNNWSPLDEAASMGHGAVVRLLIDYGADPNDGDLHGWFPLHMAARNECLEVIDVLFQKGADMNCSTSEWRWTPLLFAIEKFRATKLLLKYGADVNAVTRDGNSALILAAKEGYDSVVELLLQKGANVNTRNDSGWTALHSAAETESKGVVQLLLKAGAGIDLETKSGETALRIAAGAGKESIVELLVAQGAPLDSTDADGSTALHAAVYAKSESAAKHLIDAGADLNLPNIRGIRPLYLAADLEQTGIFQHLLDRGADVNVSGGKFGTVLQLSARFGRGEVVQMLLDRGADVNAINGESSTALQAAVAQGHVAVAQLLLRHGADVNRQGGEWGSALHAAVAKCPEMVQDLLDAGAKSDLPDRQEMVSIHHAAWSGDVTVLTKILSAQPGLAGKDAQGRTVLHHAASGNNAASSQSVTSMVRFILEQSKKTRRNYNVPDYDGWTPLHWACRGRNTNVVKMLLRIGRPGSARRLARDGWTPKKVAEYHGRKFLIPFLESAIAQETKPLRRALTFTDHTDGSPPQQPASRDEEYKTASVSVSSEEPEVMSPLSSEVVAPPSSATEAPTPQGRYRSGASCCGCRFDIYGARYQCQTCGYYDYCFKCYWTADKTHKGHDFIEIEVDD